MFTVELRKFHTKQNVLTLKNVKKCINNYLTIYMTLRLYSIGKIHYVMQHCTNSACIK